MRNVFFRYKMPDSNEKYESKTTWNAEDPVFNHKMIMPIKP